jgi:hypothetical protein
MRMLEGFEEKNFLVQEKFGCLKSIWRNCMNG